MALVSLMFGALGGKHQLGMEVLEAVSSDDREMTKRFLLTLILLAAILISAVACAPTQTPQQDDSTSDTPFESASPEAFLSSPK